MITACTVILRSNLTCFRVWLESLRSTTTLVNEVIVVDVNPNFPVQRMKRTLMEYGKNWLHPRYIPIQCVQFDGHPMGLHKAIDLAKNEYLLLADNDLFYYMRGFDQFFLDIMQKHDVRFVGIDHFLWWVQAFQSFPTVITMMTKKSYLPPDGYMENEIRVKDVFRTELGKPLGNKHWLFQSGLKGKMDTFPNPIGVFDVGCNLYLWVQETGARWLSFMGELKRTKTDVRKMTENPGEPGHYHGLNWVREHEFSTCNTNNFGLEDDFGAKKLLYHLSRSSSITSGHKRFLNFREEHRQIMKARAREAKQSTIT